MAPRICIFSIVLGAEFSFYVKSSTAYAPTFSGYNNSVLAKVICTYLKSEIFSKIGKLLQNHSFDEKQVTRTRSIVTITFTAAAATGFISRAV